MCTDKCILNMRKMHTCKHTHLLKYMHALNYMGTYMQLYANNKHTCKHTRYLDMSKNTLIKSHLIKLSLCQIAAAITITVIT